ncbi:tetratricopeptide repeat protein [Pseudobacteriovorax antillogorgiicola]|uniref:Tetratricopeptide repeat-containing protein n=1 Tax=Pseudobacteriovorax antillogorgiicola TaxID=1513793 RepID=A0A1Y6CMS2_9BACT|nr:hypothetical protein [Pseudobacteriovorax antillogorgiicola]TCS46991.1 hypothetical protein EDD56_12286 [Pseudobacteriovorax antillogorgiicola]SMF64888.1 hypothetical protein SAMN06296036_12286 [Pseudobacteriovorax antillogorgiicola]
MKPVINFTLGLGGSALLLALVSWQTFIEPPRDHEVKLQQKTRAPLGAPQEGGSISPLALPSTKSRFERHDMGSIFRLIDSGNWQAAEKALTSMISHNSQNIKAINELMILKQHDRKDLDEALNLCIRLVATAPDYPFIFDKLRELAQLAERERDVITWLQSQWQELPKERVATTIGRLWQALDDHREASLWLKEALRHEGDQQGYIWGYLARSYHHLDQKSEESAALHEAIRVHKQYNNNVDPREPKNFRATTPYKYQLLDSYWSQRKLVEAKPLLNELLRRDPANPKLLAYQAELL